MNINPKIFKDYDIRGVVPKDLDEEGAVRIGRSLAKLFAPKKVAVGHDMRISADKIAGGLIEGLIKSGVDVVDLGLISTDMAYFAAGKYDYDLAVAVSASHNPPEYNGFKIVKKGAIAVSGESGIYELREIAKSDQELTDASEFGKKSTKDLSMKFVKHCLSFIDLNKIKDFKIIVDAGNAMAGFVIPKFALYLPVNFIPMYFTLDGNFPNHIPNPILPSATQDLKKKILQENADFGIAFDGDGDRMYLMDETGKLLSGTVTTAMLAKAILKKHPGENILYNAVAGRIVPEIVKEMGGKYKRVRVGHTLIKEAMRENNAYFAGEHSGHYYFRDNFYADSAFVAMLLSLELISESDKPLSEIVKEFDIYPHIDETNFAVKDKQGVMKQIAESKQKDAKEIDWLDGVSIWFDDSWVNIRPSNTQSLLRLNIEADNETILKQRKREFMSLINDLGGELVKE